MSALRATPHPGPFERGGTFRPRLSTRIRRRVRQSTVVHVLRNIDYPARYSSWWISVRLYRVALASHQRQARYRVEARRAWMEERVYPFRPSRVKL